MRNEFLLLSVRELSSVVDFISHRFHIAIPNGGSSSALLCVKTSENGKGSSVCQKFNIPKGKF